MILIASIHIHYAKCPNFVNCSKEKKLEIHLYAKRFQKATSPEKKKLK